MIDALKSGHIRHAGLDVFNIEPLPADHPLTKLRQRDAVGAFRLPHAGGEREFDARGVGALPADRERKIAAPLVPFVPLVGRSRAAVAPGRRRSSLRAAAILPAEQTPHPSRCRSRRQRSTFSHKRAEGKKSPPRRTLRPHPEEPRSGRLEGWLRQMGLHGSLAATDALLTHEVWRSIHHLRDRLAARGRIRIAAEIPRAQRAFAERALDRADDGVPRPPSRRDAPASSRPTRSCRSGWRCPCPRCRAPSRAPARTPTGNCLPD